VCTCEEGAWSKGGEARRRKTQGGKREGSSGEFESRFGFALSIEEENSEREEREEVTENSRMEGRRAERRRAENQPRMEEWERRAEGRTAPE